MKKVYYCLAFLVSIGPIVLMGEPCFSQEVAVTDVSFSVRDSNVVVYYNLSGPPNKAYKVVLTLRREGDSRFRFVPIDVSGDIGRGNFSGADRHIVWHMYSDIPDGLGGNDYYFQVTASLLEGGGISWLYYVGGVMVLGGAAAAVLYKTLSPGKSGVASFPVPPIRP